MRHPLLVTFRCWLAEALGLALFVTFSLGAVALARIGVLPEGPAQTLVPGLVVLALICGLSDVSGAHFNPAVTLAFALRGSFPWTRVPGYLLAQLLGAQVGVWVIAALLPLPKAQEHLPPWGVFGLEAGCTALLLLVILATAKRKAEVGDQAGVVIAGTLALCLFTFSGLTPLSVNPARSLAAALTLGTVLANWPHLLGPLAGSVISTGLTFLLRGPLNEQEEATAQGGAKEA